MLLYFIVEASVSIETKGIHFHYNPRITFYSCRAFPRFYISTDLLSSLLLLLLLLRSPALHFSKFVRDGVLIGTAIQHVIQFGTSCPLFAIVDEISLQYLDIRNQWTVHQYISREGSATLRVQQHYPTLTLAIGLRYHQATHLDGVVATAVGQVVDLNRIASLEVGEVAALAKLSELLVLKLVQEGRGAATRDLVLAAR